MDNWDSLRAGFVLRGLSLGAFSAMLLFASLVVLDNSEIEKVIPDSSFRSLSIMFGYIAAIFGFNYTMALRGDNFMGWKVEALVSLGFVFLLVSVFLAFAFPREVSSESSGLIGFFSSDVKEEPRWAFAWLAILSVPSFLYAYLELRSMRVWGE